MHVLVKYKERRSNVIAAIIADITTFFTALLGWVSEIIEFVVDQPILMIFVIIALASIVVGMARRFIPGRGV